MCEIIRDIPDYALEKQNVSVETMMCNFDRTIDEGTESRLKSGEMCGYAAWNFYGVVWFNPDIHKFECLIKQYRYPQALLRASTLEEIMKMASDEFGWL